MAEQFLNLPKDEQIEILNALSPKMGLTPQIIEKDIWVCWVLDKLFTMPNALPMVFKGGTSLSKVFNAIQRFSEDCDVTISYLGFNNDFDPFLDNVSKTALKKFTEKLRNQLQDYVYSTIQPYFQKVLADQFGNSVQLIISENGEQVQVQYPTNTKNIVSYISSHVLIEFGARNSISPNNEHTIYSAASKFLAELEFPQANLNVLSPLRTFWEKATLIHVECHRPEFHESAHRLSRHWHDLAVLSQHSIGQAALEDKYLLFDVVKHKKKFFPTNYSQYDLCLNKKIKLLPNKEQIPKLRNDYSQMIQAGMFSQQPINFEEITLLLSELEQKINK